VYSCPTGWYFSDFKTLEVVKGNGVEPSNLNVVVLGVLRILNVIPPSVEDEIALCNLLKFHRLVGLAKRCAVPPRHLRELVGLADFWIALNLRVIYLSEDRQVLILKEQSYNLITLLVSVNATDFLLLLKGELIGGVLDFLSEVLELQFSLLLPDNTLDIKRQVVVEIESHLSFSFLFYYRLSSLSPS